MKPVLRDVTPDDLRMSTDVEPLRALSELRSCADVRGVPLPLTTPWPTLGRFLATGADPEAAARPRRRRTRIAAGTGGMTAARKAGFP
ncbi:hypothetical protein QF034_006137 [Streptomyces africanus]|uniref:Uncharacterized protein n=1 Tax=Streptomyces africanus TaxID=231024 RepID=A0ABU0QWY8_9ACTN|nr:hypothetical protein [Streptomyces africanus]